MDIRWKAHGVTIVPGCSRPLVCTGWAISLLCTNRLGKCSSLLRLQGSLVLLGLNADSQVKRPD